MFDDYISQDEISALSVISNGQLDESPLRDAADLLDSIEA